MMYTVSLFQNVCTGFMSSGSILWNVSQGTTTEQDNRFSDKEKKLLKQMKFGDCLSQRVSGVYKFYTNIHEKIMIVSYILTGWYV